MESAPSILPVGGGKSRRRRWLVVIAAVVAVGYFALGLSYWIMQDSFVFPGAARQGQRDAIVPPSGRYEVVQLRSSAGGKIVAVFGKALAWDEQVDADGAQRPTVLFFYGNGMCAADCMQEFDHLRRLGLNVIIPDYQGYGMSDGKPSEAGCYAAADAAYDYLMSRSDVDHGKLEAMGWSLGAAVAIDLASRKPIVALATVSAFSSLREMGRAVAPWLPTSLILKYRFDNLSKIAGISCPILIAHGTVDGIVPPVMSDRLAAAARAKVTRIRVDGADHNDVFDVGGDPLWQALDEFLN